MIMYFDAYYLWITVNYAWSCYLTALVIVYFDEVLQQKCVALSTIEAKYIIVTEVGKEIL